MPTWSSALELSSSRTVTAGSPQCLADAIRCGADLRIYTEFIHNQHIDPASDNDELVREVSDFPVTYLLDDRWTAGIMTQRMPISPPDGFGPRPSMSFFMYNQDGQQAIARPYLDGQPTNGSPGPSAVPDHPDMPKYHQQDAYDADTNAPSQNFIYDFECFRYMIRDDWREVLAHDENGNVLTGSLDDLTDAFAAGAEVKVAITSLCDDLAEPNQPPLDHTLFVQTGPCYYNTQRRLFSAGTRPVVRVRPAIPLRYTSRGWDFGWLMVRNDGLVARWLCDPYTLKFHKSQCRCPIRWFVR